MIKNISVPIILSLIGVSNIVYAWNLSTPLIEPYVSLYPTPLPGIKDELNYSLLDSIGSKVYEIEITSFWNRTHEYNTYIQYAAKSYNIPNNLIRAIMYVESGGFKSKVSYVGAIGLMQIKYPTALSLGYSGYRWELFNPEPNIILGTKYLRQQRDRYDSDILDVIAAYHQGSVFRWKKSDRRQPMSISLETAIKYGKMIRLNGPYDRNEYGPYYNEIYVKRVIKMYDLFNQTIF